MAILASSDVSVSRLRLALKISAPNEGIQKPPSGARCVKSPQQNPDRGTGENFCIVPAAQALQLEPRLVGAFSLVFLHHRSESNFPTMSFMRAVKL